MSRDILNYAETNTIKVVKSAMLLMTSRSGLMWINTSLDMKIKITLIVLACTGLTTQLSAQGFVQFSNRNQAVGLDAPIFLSNGIDRVSGSQFLVELIAGTSPANLSSIAVAGFLTGADAGYFDGGTQEVPLRPGTTTSYVQIRAWNTSYGATFSEAVANAVSTGDIFGSSPILLVTTEGPGNPIALTSLTSFTFGPNIPEPSSLSLLSLGFCVVLIKRSSNKTIRAALRAV